MRQGPPHSPPPSSPPPYATPPDTSPTAARREDFSPSYSSTGKFHHFDAALQQDPGWKQFGDYATLELDPTKHRKEYERIMRIIETSSSNKSGLKVKTIQVVWNKNLNRIFEGYAEVMKSRSGQKEFQPSWTEDGNASLRKDVMERFRAMVDRQGSQMGGCTIIPVFHGTRRENIPGILKSGFAALQSTDFGFFGCVNKKKKKKEKKKNPIHFVSDAVHQERDCISHPMPTMQPRYTVVNL
jgi:hypothetical protein